MGFQNSSFELLFKKTFSQSFNVSSLLFCEEVHTHIYIFPPGSRALFGAACVLFIEKKLMLQSNLTLVMCLSYVQYWWFTSNVLVPLSLKHDNSSRVLRLLWSSRFAANDLEETNCKKFTYVSLVLAKD